MKKLIVLASLILFLGCVDQLDQGVLPHKEEILEVFEGSIETEEISLDFSTFNGYIEVNLWSDQAYKVEVTKWARGTTSAKAKEDAENIQVDFSEEERAGGTVLVLEIEYVKNAGAYIKAYLPEKSFNTVELSTSNGYIEVDKIEASDVSLKTSNGYIDASITADDIDISTSNGRITGAFQGNEVNIDTSNGEIDIECGDGGDYTISTSNGRVVVEVGSRGEFDITASNGSIDITVAGDFTFDLKTSNAQITVDADNVTYTVDSKTHKKGSTADDAEVSITASTSNGTVRVRKR